tara:strand:- start:182 stop:550 length:369 start_codon:yes stop_codon:yes gene_type:complete
MDITGKFGRIGTVLLPVALLGGFFKYLHPLNSILHGIEGWGARKIALTLFISFFSIWSLLYVSSVFFVRIADWVWSGTNSDLSKNINYKPNQENSSKNNTNYQNSEERDALLKLELRDENAA